MEKRTRAGKTAYDIMTKTSGSGTPYTHKHFEAYKNPYIDDWVIENDRAYLERPFNVFLKAVSEVMGWPYNVCIATAYGKLVQLALDCELPEQVAEKIAHFQPVMAMWEDENGDPQSYHHYFHLPPEDWTALTRTLFEMHEASKKANPKNPVET
jgi:hypothetical protein